MHQCTATIIREPRRTPAGRISNVRFGQITAALAREECPGSKAIVLVNADTRSVTGSPNAQMVLLVVDEAHKATGNYAYVTLVREIMAQTSHFRVVALSATPGTDFVAIQVRPLTPSLLITTRAFSYFFLELAHD